MKIQLETINHKNKSFSLLFNPRLNDLFYWHFHPEYELVYIEGCNGTRNIGNHISNYVGSDLVLIGSNIPHLNFDYGVKTDYKKVVIHLDKDFVESHFKSVPELSSINKMFIKSSYGLSFDTKFKEQIGQQLFKLENLSHFDQYHQLLEILQKLSILTEFKLLHEQPFNNSFNEKNLERMKKIYAFIDKNYHRKIELYEVAQISNLSKEAFCRYFKQMSQYTFTEFLNRYRISQSKRLLIAGITVSEACYQTGFESLSYFNRVFKKITGENPRYFKNKFHL